MSIPVRLSIEKKLLDCFKNAMMLFQNDVEYKTLTMFADLLSPSKEFKVQDESEVMKTKINATIFGQALLIFTQFLLSYHDKNPLVCYILLRPIYEKLTEGRYIILVDDARYRYLIREFTDSCDQIKALYNYDLSLIDNSDHTAKVRLDEEFNKVHKRRYKECLLLLSEHPGFSDEEIKKISNYEELCNHPKIKRRRMYWYGTSNMKSYDKLENKVITLSKQYKVPLEIEYDTSEWLFIREYANLCIHTSLFMGEELYEMTEENNVGRIKLLYPDKYPLLHMIYIIALSRLAGIYRNMIYYTRHNIYMRNIDEIIHELFNLASVDR